MILINCMSRVNRSVYLFGWRTIDKLKTNDLIFYILQKSRTCFDILVSELIDPVSLFSKSESITKPLYKIIDVYFIQKIIIQNNISFGIVLVLFITKARHVPKQLIKIGNCSVYFAKTKISNTLVND